MDTPAARCLGKISALGRQMSEKKEAVNNISAGHGWEGVRTQQGKVAS